MKAGSGDSSSGLLVYSSGRDGAWAVGPGERDGRICDVRWSACTGARHAGEYRERRQQQRPARVHHGGRGRAGAVGRGLSKIEELLHSSDVSERLMAVKRIRELLSVEGESFIEHVLYNVVPQLVPSGWATSRRCGRRCGR